MSGVWSGKLDCTFHGKMHWELNEPLWFLSEAASEHHDLWKEMGVRITHHKPTSKSKVYAPKGFDTDLASIPRAGWALVSPWDVARPAIIHDVLYAAIRKFRYHHNDDKIAFKAKKVADLVFKHAMDDAEPPVSGWKKWLCYQAVNWFGKSSVAPTEADK